VIPAVGHDDWGREKPQHDLASPPQKLAVGDTGWRRIGPQLRVFLNDVKVQRCTAYDCDAGTVTRHRLDDEGRIYIDPATQKVAVETVTGTVEVRWI
jgi:hypothetical protein